MVARDASSSFDRVLKANLHFERARSSRAQFFVCFIEVAAHERRITRRSKTNKRLRLAIPGTS